MAGLDLTPVSGGRGSRTPLAEIDTTLAETIEEAKVYCESHSDRLQTPSFPDRDSAERWLSEARAYAYQRPAGRIVVSGNTAAAPLADGTKSKTEYVARFR